MKIAVAGATGMIGSLVVAQLERDGHHVVKLSRRTGVDVMSGTGVAERLTGVDALIDCLGVTTTKAKVSVEFFTTTTRNLIRAEREMGVGHHVALSVVGARDAMTGYYQGKVEQERIVRGSGIPYTMVRATQFHEFAEQLVENSKVGPFVVAPKMLSAPIAAAEVANALAELVTQPPRGESLELNGPEPRQMSDLVKAVAKARGLRSPVIAVGLPGAGGRALREGQLVSKRPWRTGEQTFNEWLTTRRS